LVTPEEVNLDPYTNMPIQTAAYNTIQGIGPPLAIGGQEITNDIRRNLSMSK
jgi:hypothetical protein